MKSLARKKTKKEPSRLHISWWWGSTYIYRYFLRLVIRLDEDQLMSMFGNDSEPYQQHQASNQNGHSDVLRATSASNAGGSSASDTWTLEKGRTTLSKPNAPSTPSDSNSISEVSNEEPMQEGLEKFRSEPEVQSFADLYNEGGSQQFSKGELQQALAGLDSSLDPKRAKRYPNS